MIRTAFVFPGQGSQFVGMGKSLYEASSSCRLVFQEVDDAVNFPLSKLMFEGNIKELTLTENAQPALMAVSVALITLLYDRMECQTVKQLASSVAGHSLGEYTALTVAGAFEIYQSAALLRVRGKAMQQAVPMGKGIMITILGLDINQVTILIDQVREKHPESVCDLAGDNAPDQLVISGNSNITKTVFTLAKQMGAKRVLSLPVSGPFHCKLMLYARNILYEQLHDFTIKSPQIPIYSNIDAKPTSDPKQIRKNLIDQVCGCVRWRESICSMISDGHNQFIELGAGRVLSSLIKRIDKKIKSKSIQDITDIDHYVSNVT